MPHGMRVALAVAAALCLAHTAALRADPPGAVLPVRLAMTAGVPEGSRSALMQEVAAIWRRAGVTVDWREAGAASAGTFRVIVTAGERPHTNDGHAWPVAELLLDGDGQPVAVASLPAALRVLDAAGVRGEPASLSARRLGLVLGRAVAHEIGHYLLATTGHRSRGLMRTRIDAGDFADLREGGFWLDREAAQTLRSSSPLAALAAPILVAQR